MLSLESKKSSDYCTFCPKMCHFSCPVAEAEKNEAYTPWGKQQTTKLISEGKLPLNAQNALPAYKCLTCRVSETFCAHEIVVADSLHELREKAVERDVAPPEVFAFEQQFRSHNNPYNRDLQEKLLKITPMRFMDANQSTVLFPTCHSLAASPSPLVDHLEVFEKLKIDTIRVHNEPLQCCGYSLWVLGFKKEFEELAQLQYQSLKNSKTIVVSSPECAWAMKELYPRLGFPLGEKVLTLSEFIAARLKNFAFRAKAKSKSKFFYHDSCYLGRYLGQYEEPRQMLEMVTGYAPQEFSWNRKESLCSGAGGGYSLTSPEGAKAIPKRHLEEMRDKEIKTLVTSCPQSALHFKEVGREQGIVVKDLVEFVNENLLET